MAVKLRRPILVGGLGLTFGVWVLDSLYPSAIDLNATPVWGAIAIGSGFWWLKQRFSSSDVALSPQPIDRTQVDQSLAVTSALIERLAVEPETKPAEIQSFQQRRLAIQTELDRQDLRLSILGGPSVGKTALLQFLASHWTPSCPTPGPTLPQQVDITTVPSLFTEPDAEQVIAPLDQAAVQAADLLVFVTAGDLTDPEFQVLHQLITQQHRVVLVFNKQDQYLPSERPLILQQLRQRMKSWLSDQDVVAIATAPGVRKVRQHQADGSLQERVEQPTADVSALTERLSEIVGQENHRLILATGLRRSQALQSEVQAKLNQLRRSRALPLIEQSQWIAAATAFANPVPTLDLLATAAINTQLILDLSAIYQQKFSLQQAKTATTALAGLMVKLGLVEMTSQAIAPLLKSNAVTFVAGGLLQGISAAYLTRLAGLSLIEYFQEQSQTEQSLTSSPLQIERLTQKLKAVFQDNQRTAFLKTLVKQGIDRLTPTIAPAEGEVRANA